MTFSARTVTTASAAPAASIPSCANPDVAFVTVTYGTGPIVVEMIASLVASLGGRDIAYEVIVVDNPHPRHPGRTARELSLFTAGARVVTPVRNLGFGGGCELGALFARAPTLAFVNPDLEFEGGWLEPLLEQLDTDPMPSIVAPMLRNPDGTVQEVGQRVFSNGHTAAVVDPAARADYASAACWVVRSDEHERLGGFDSDYHPAYFEDVDYALRADRRGGGTAVVSTVSVVHHRGGGAPDHTVSADEQHRVLVDAWPQLRWRQPDEFSRRSRRGSGEPA